MCPAVRVSLPRTTGRTADVRSVVRAGEGRIGGGRGSASTVLRATTKRSRRRAALRWGTGPDSTGSSRSEWLPHAEVRYIAVLVDGRIVLTTSSCLDPSALRPFGCILRARPMHAHETVRRTP